MAEDKARMWHNLTSRFLDEVARWTPPPPRHRKRREELEGQVSLDELLDGGDDA